MAGAHGKRASDSVNSPNEWRRNTTIRRTPSTWRPCVMIVSTRTLEIVDSLHHSTCSPRRWLFGPDRLRDQVVADVDDDLDGREAHGKRVGHASEKRMDEELESLIR